MNSFGNIYRLTSFGESHGPAMGGVIDGVPAGEIIDLGEVAVQLARRRPGTGKAVTGRSEADLCEFLSGLMAVDENGDVAGGISPETSKAVTLGTSIGFIIRNNDQHSGDYEALRHIFRPSHADYAWQQKYGLRDWRGGGRSSGRETVSRVVAGAIARQILRRYGVNIEAVLEEIGGVPVAQGGFEILSRAKDDGDSLGGVVSCRVSGCPAGWGEPVFGKLQQMLAGAMMSIGGAKGFEYGAGFAISKMKGSEANDFMRAGAGGYPEFLSNNSGGIQGGISNGCDIIMRVAFKPTPTISKAQTTVSDSGHDVTLEARGRHDPCIAVRAVPVVESMAAMVLLDAALMARTGRLD